MSMIQNNEVLLLVLAYCVIREVWFSYQTHKLLNKLMSRSYYDFKTSENAGKLEKSIGEQIRDDELPEDLRILSGIG